MGRYILCFVVCLLSIGCSSTKERSLSPFPAAPLFVKVEKDPIIEVNDAGNYVVKPSLVQWATQARTYIPRVEQWKSKNEIP
jgi:hypothetical protein